MTTLHGTILALFQKRGEAKAYSLQREVGGYRTVSAADYLEKTLLFSSYLRSRGVGTGDRVILLSENGPEWTIAALAILNLGAVVVPVASIASILELKNTIRDAHPKFCILSKRVSSFRQVEEFVQLEKVDSLAWDLQEDNPLKSWLENQKPMGIEETNGEDAQAFLIYTSGTTGHPKAVPISHKNILTNARAVLQVICAKESDRLVSVLPLSHMFEFTGGFVTPALIGCPVTYVKSLKADDLLQALKDSKATILIGVPLLFEVISRNLKAKLDAMPFPLPKIFATFRLLVVARPWLGPILFAPVHKALGGHLRFLMAGGSRLQPATFEYFQGFGIKVLQGYGLTETSPVLTVTSPETAAPDHVGAAIPGVELGIFTENGEALPMGEEGEIWARGPSVFKGYLNHEHSQGAFFGDWFRTGDLGNLDARGMLRITGRKKDLIVTAAGKNVYPEEIESLVFASGFFLEACALGLQDSAGHEKIGLVLVPDRSKFPGKNFEEIRREAARTAAESCRILAEYKWPQRIEVLFEELPKTATRKIKKHEVKKQLLVKNENSPQAAIGAGGALDLTDELEGAIGQGIFSITGIAAETIRLQDSLTKELGLDSLTFVELISHVEKKFETRIEGLEFGCLQTLEDLVGALEFAAGPPKKLSIFSRVYFADFSPWENGRFFWRLPRRAINVLFRAMLKIRHRMKVEGLENLQPGGPFLFTPNHSSHFDLLTIAGSIPGDMLHATFAVAAKDYFFNRTWKALLTRLVVNAIPFDRKGRINESMEICREALKMGGSLVIFPEGTRSPNGKLQDFKPGVAHLLAGHPNARAVPVFIDGAYGIMPKGSKLPGRGALRIVYGQPISFRESGNDADSLKKIAERLRQEVQSLAGKGGS